MVSKLFRYINAAVLVCSEYESFYCDQRSEFRRMFRGCESLREATRPDMIGKWGTVRIFKNTKHKKH